MSYILKGRLCGLICDDCDEPLARVGVRLYQPESDDKLSARAVADPKETVALLTDAQAKQRASSLLAETTTDDQGAFTVELDDKKYNGGPVEVDLYFETVPRPRQSKKTKPLQVAVTTLQPAWRQSDAGSVGVWQYCLPNRLWCLILSRFGVWSICGHLRTCKEHQPIPGALVSAFDADWLQDDSLGSATTDFAGHFLITYLREDFEKTPLSAWGINFELVGGPDVYFTADLGGNSILKETQADGRKPGRQNVGPCLCVDLCTDTVEVGDPETVPHWLQVEVFDIHPTPGTPGSQFSVEGYAGDPTTGAYAFGGDVTLKGNCPLTNIATGNALEYRFQIGEWTWPGTPDDPTVLPSVAPGGLVPVTQMLSTEVGYVFYTDGNGKAASYPVDIAATDNADGWIKLQGRPVKVPMYNAPNATAIVNIDHSNFIRTFDLFVLNSLQITTAHPAKLPGGLLKADAGRSLTNTEREPIRRYTLRFEVRDFVTSAALPGDQLDSLILDNSPVIRQLDLEEQHANACNPLAGAANAHVLYTVDHPHLRSFDITISNNNNVQVHPPPAFSGSPTVAMPSGAFVAGNYFFRGGAGGPHLASNNGGVPVAIGADPSCGYYVTLRWQTRIWNAPAESTTIIYCK
jgi:hypothetical protein